MAKESALAQQKQAAQRGVEEEVAREATLGEKVAATAAAVAASTAERDARAAEARRP